MPYFQNIYELSHVPLQFTTPFSETCIYSFRHPEYRQICSNTNKTKHILLSWGSLSKNNLSYVHEQYPHSYSAFMNVHPWKLILFSSVVEVPEDSSQLSAGKFSEARYIFPIFSINLFAYTQINKLEFWLIGFIQGDW